MSLERIERTGLWKTSLLKNDTGLDEVKKESLRVALNSFRNKTEVLVSKIVSDLPGLTIHDISHLDALWETASLIAGEEYAFNPLEAFVFGGAILLHDSALCFEAYEGGQEGIRATVTWKDVYSSLCDGEYDEETIKREADFIALRHLHAEQAAKLLERSWKNPDTKEDVFLLEDSSLRNHLGRIIGQIASSHHWNIEKVESTLPNQMNALAGYPREWRINPVKIACLLRCADAAHIDNERAPDFFYALLKKQGVSFQHWQAQNRLANVDLDQTDIDNSTLLYTSSRAFNEDETESWWVAYDAVCLVDKEIRACNAILESQSLQFQVRRVKGVENPKLMSQYIQVEGWSPHSAQLHVSNIEQLVENLGGEKLYGNGSDLLGVSLRELIQNARDAIQARKNINEDFNEEIVIKVYSENDNYWLIVEDNGVGMSERIITGPLLDFGTSFWTSSLVQSEFPGLRASKFKSVGQFGIGFYSIFMVADYVQVSSKEWKEGLSNVNQLVFKDGITFRPLLKKGNPEGFLPSTSTQIKLRLKKEILSPDMKIKVTMNLLNTPDIYVELKDYISTLCAGLDTDVYIQQNGDKKERIHISIEKSDFDVRTWLKTISFSSYQHDSSTSEYIDKNIDRVRLIIDNEKIVGLAAISTDIRTNSRTLLNIDTIGGLSGQVHGRGSGNFIGFMDHMPNSAKRDLQVIPTSSEPIKRWGEEQLEILQKTSLSEHEKCIAASGLSHFDIDPTPIAYILVAIDKKALFLTFEQLSSMIDSMPIAIIKSGIGEDHADSYNNIQNIDNMVLIKPVAGVSGNFLSLKMENGIPKNNNSIIDCLHRMLVQKGKNVKWEFLNNIAKDKFTGVDLGIMMVRKSE